MKNRYELTPNGKYALVYIRYRGQERATIISAEDLERVKKMPSTWYGEKRACTMYARADIPGRPRRHVYLHRYIMQPADYNVIDHQDHDGLNNTRENLIEITQVDNFVGRRDRCDPYGICAYRNYENGCTGYIPADDINEGISL